MGSCPKTMDRGSWPPKAADTDIRTIEQDFEVHPGILGKCTYSQKNEPGSEPGLNE